MPGGKLLRASESEKAAQIRREIGAGPDDEVLIGKFQEDVVLEGKLKRSSESEQAARIRESMGVGADDEVFVVRT
jgi:Flp pilus assembly secretin CpaC